MSWRWEFGFLMLFVSIVNFYTGKKIASRNTGNRKAWLFGGIFISLLPLFYFKYANFFLESMNVITSEAGYDISNLYVSVILPVGISFFTFQALSYSIDIYNEKIKPETNLVNFIGFVAFFPQLIAGPIERASNMLPQFKEKHVFNFDHFKEGAMLFIWGLFKKIVIADRLAIYSDPVFNSPELYSGQTIFLATLFFTFQIYCDFSGYSDMAIGSARILGFKLMQNFNLPYLSSSIGEFWKRWHISLSSWFSDYLYIPLGGNRVPIRRWVFNIYVVFLVSGLWHGANWTFVIWGGLHASYYLVEYIGKKIISYFNIESIRNQKSYKYFRIFVTFLLVFYSWLFFRANSLSDALYMSGKVFEFSGSLWFGSSSVTTLLSLALIIFLIVVELLQYNKKIPVYINQESVFPKWLVWASYIILLLGISIFGISSNAFIYFQF
ncbi:MBOAT family O-acyltransferase [Rhodohalobacter sulfatireducens]|uniref:MBOAT family protein n=1 Tax=Rhodohalobacter sulfatireducens TaxID=2911366 RepID=A0ABS9KIZ6_9BACT|nr:MBOAT family O-acyltransferase [Rhodohalobacter sulfatireducens]MCG2590796.1 hypothetical protein [Rhodohalobacter sulfatireducens]